MITARTRQERGLSLFGFQSAFTISTEKIKGDLYHWQSFSIWPVFIPQSIYGVQDQKPNIDD
jgi:hypothetical protein